MHGSRRVACVSAVLVLVWGVSSAMPCPIPVFQYALENWPADPYEVTVYHRGGLSQEQRKALALLADAEDGGDASANLRVRVHDVSEEEDVELPPEATSSPYVQVRYPAHVRLRDPVWSGGLSVEALRSLLNSPVRERLVSLLLARKTAVWVLLEGEDRSRNDAVFEVLQQELSRLEKTLVLPSSAQWEDQTVQIYDKVSFEIIRLRRDDPNERVLIEMLLMSEGDLVEFGQVPIAFPIYGRGLILYALVDKGINRWTIDDAGMFLTGPCSCQVKAANPGLDLLLSIDWEGKVEPLAPRSVAAPVGTGGFIRRLEEAQDEGIDD